MKLHPDFACFSFIALLSWLEIAKFRKPITENNLRQTKRPFYLPDFDFSISIDFLGFVLFAGKF